MKFKRILILTMLLMMVAVMPAFARPHKERLPIFMGKVLEVSKDEKNHSVRVRAKGYIKGCSVYEEELVLIITSDTEYIPTSCEAEAKVEKEVCVGDNVFAKLDKAMTKSIPPQVVARKIQITKVNK